MKTESAGIYRKAKNSEVVTSAQEKAQDVMHTVTDFTKETGIKIKDSIHDFGVSAEHAAENAGSKIKRGSIFIASMISQKAKIVGSKISGKID